MDQRFVETIRAELTRRHFFGRTANGLALAALAGLLEKTSNAAAGQAAASAAAAGPRLPHFSPRARRAIYLFMSGGPSQLDMFDPKPRLVELNGQPMPESFTRGQRVAQLMGQELRCVGSKFRFARHGQGGAEMSELLPHTARVADQLA